MAWSYFNEDWTLWLYLIRWSTSLLFPQFCQGIWRLIVFQIKCLELRQASKRLIMSCDFCWLFPEIKSNQIFCFTALIFIQYGRRIESKRHCWLIVSIEFRYKVECVHCVGNKPRFDYNLLHSTCILFIFFLLYNFFFFLLFFPSFMLE